MKKSGTVSIAVALSAMMLTVGVQAASVDEVKDAATAGVVWLVDQQEANGQFSPGWETCALTAFAVKKIMHHATDPVYGLGLASPFDPDYVYVDNVENGLDYMLTNCTTVVPIDNVPVGVDTDGNGEAIVFNTGRHEIYATGISLMTLCETGALDRVVGGTGPLAGMTYGEVAQNTMDYLLWGQNEVGTKEGGWGYQANDTRSDNSISGYATLGLTYAVTAPPEGCGFSALIPEVTKTRMNTWVDYIQNDISGGSGYEAPNSWVNVLKTGNLLQQMAFVGDGSEATRVVNALGYLEDHWNDATIDPGWMGATVSNYQATYTLMKGLKGLNIQTFGTAPIDWKADFEEKLLDQQNADGSWPGTTWDYGTTPILSTTWALMTLQQAAPVLSMTVELDVHPAGCPNPLNKKSKGVTPMAILGTADLDVTTIDVSTLQINGVSPTRSALEDVATPYEGGLSDPLSRDDCSEAGADGFMDLTLKFDTQAVLENVDKGVQMMEITGETLDGTPFTGQDVVWVK